MLLNPQLRMPDSPFLTSLFKSSYLSRCKCLHRSACLAIRIRHFKAGGCPPRPLGLPILWEEAINLTRQAETEDKQKSKFPCLWDVTQRLCPHTFHAMPRGLSGVCQDGPSYKSELKSHLFHKTFPGGKEPWAVLVDTMTSHRYTPGFLSPNRSVRILHLSSQPQTCTWPGTIPALGCCFPRICSIWCSAIILMKKKSPKYNLLQ